MFLCVCVQEHTGACVHTCVCPCLCVYTHVEVRGHLWLSLLFFFLRQCLSLAWGSLIGLSWVICEPQGSSVPAFPALRLQATTSGTFTWVLGIKLRFSCYQIHYLSNVTDVEPFWKSKNSLDHLKYLHSSAFKSIFCYPCTLKKTETKESSFQDRAQCLAFHD